MSFRRPFDGDFPITTGYLERYPDSVLAQYPNLNPYHEGIDSAMPVGTPLYAVKSGIISYVDSLNDANGMGLIVTAGNEAFLYWHVSAIDVAAGQAVQQGQLIALSGNSGYSTGAHLHFQLKVNGQLADPTPYLSKEGGGPTMEEIFKNIFITIIGRWPNADEIFRFGNSGKTPYTYVQDEYLKGSNSSCVGIWGFLDPAKAKTDQDAAVSAATAPLQAQVKTLTDQVNTLKNQPAPEPLKVDVPGPTKTITVPGPTQTITVTDPTKIDGGELLKELLRRLFHREGVTQQ